jgi:hypothetical protein
MFLHYDFATHRDRQMIIVNPHRKDSPVREHCTCCLTDCPEAVIRCRPGCFAAMFRDPRPCPRGSAAAPAVPVLLLMPAVAASFGLQDQNPEHKIMTTEP